jgi:hemolysin III
MAHVFRHHTLAPGRPQRRGEEIANAVSHGGALLLALAALPVLIVNSVARELGSASIVGVTIFGATLVLLYLTSVLYHALPEGTAKRVFRILDHAAIYLLIAGTYTPFTLGVLAGAWGWSLFGIIWALACAGIVAKAIGGVRFAAASLVLYLLMGWLVVIAADPMLTRVDPAGLGWLLAGGLAYTLGVPFFALDSRLRYGHFIWHLFVVAGSACHFVAVLNYAG